MNQAAEPTSPATEEPKKPLVMVRAGHHMRLLDAFRAALMLLETATDALEQELSEVERFKLVTGLRRQIIGLQGAK